MASPFAFENSFASYKRKEDKRHLSTRTRMRVLTALDSETTESQSVKNSEPNDAEKRANFRSTLCDIMKNEGSYISDLQSLKMTLNHPGLKGVALSLDKLLENVANMISLHENLKLELDDNTSSVPCIFYNFKHSLNLYTNYCCYMVRTHPDIEKMCGRADSEFWKHYEELRQIPLLHMKKYSSVLSSLLLVLTEQENKLLHQIMHAIEETVYEMENICNAPSNAVKMLHIQQRLVKRQPKIMVPGRICIKEGLLLKMKRNGTGGEERYFFLFSDILMCCKKSRNAKSWLFLSSLICSTIIPLDQCSVSLLMGSLPEGGALFKISWDSNVCLLFSSDRCVAEAWIQAIQGAICRCKEIMAQRTVEKKPKSTMLKRATMVKRQSQVTLRKRASDASNHSRSSIRHLSRNHKKSSSFKQILKLSFVDFKK